MLTLITPPVGAAGRGTRQRTALPLMKSARAGSAPSDPSTAASHSSEAPVGAKFAPEKINVARPSAASSAAMGGWMALRLGGSFGW